MATRLSNFSRLVPEDDGDSDDDGMNAVENTSSEDEIPAVHSHSYVDIMDTDLIAESRRHSRRWHAERFRHDYVYGPSKERKTCVWSGGSTYSWPGKSVGIIWVGVYGMNSACVVTRAGYLDVMRAKRSYKYKTKEMVLRLFMEAAISEMEDLELEESPSELREKFGQSFQRPFGFVSGIPCIDVVDTECGHEASIDEYDKINDTELGYDDSIWKKIFDDVNSGQPPREYDATKLLGVIQEKMKIDPTCFGDEHLEASGVECDEKTAVEFLKRMMSRGGAFTIDETIQVAISAFQLLLQKKFKANEIEVSVVDPDYLISWEEAKSTGKHCTLWELETSDIEIHLALINDEPGSRSSISSSG